jgi:hypothetical protein
MCRLCFEEEEGEQKDLIVEFLQDFTIKDLAKYIYDLSTLTDRDFELFTKTQAKQQWCLSETDLKDVDFGTCENPIMHNSHPVYLYERRDLDYLAIEKYGGLSEMLEVQEKRRNRKRKREEEKLIEREDELKEALEEYGLPRPEKSELCKKYILDKMPKIKGVKQDLNSITDRLEIMFFYYSFTNYRELLQNLLISMNYTSKNFDEYQEFERGHGLCEMACRWALRDYVKNTMSQEDWDVIPPSLIPSVERFTSLLATKGPPP